MNNGTSKKSAVQIKFENFLVQFADDKKGVAGVAMLSITLIIAIIAPFISPYDPNDLSDSIMSPPTSDHFFGTDHFGRDILSRVFYGIRVSFLFGFGVGFLALLIGIIIGAIPAYYGGWLDTLFSRITEFFMLVPRLFLIILLISIFGNSINISMFVIAITIWPSNARITRAQILAIKNRAFIKAAKVSGASDYRILFNHILPNGIYPVIVNSTLQMGNAVVTEASLSYLGLGDLNVISLGQILMQAQRQLHTWWMALFPGLFICIIVLGFNFVGGGINHALNPRLREQ